jgi:hypothetical protein
VLDADLLNSLRYVVHARLDVTVIPAASETTGHIMPVYAKQTS